MKASTYLAALARAHVGANPPLTALELAALKQSVVVASGLGTLLGRIARNPALNGPALGSAGAHPHTRHRGGPGAAHT